MNPRLKQNLILTVTCLVAILLSVNLADEEYFLPALAGIGSLAFILARLLRLEADIILLGFVVIGYLVGNRGFAQFTFARGLPLLPAEAALAGALTWRLVRSAFEKKRLLTPDSLNWSLLAWLVLGLSRLVFDLPAYGLLAVRDAAMVYYTLFFFIVRLMVRGNPAARRYLLGCILTGCVGLAVVYPLSWLFPEFFLHHLTYNGSPLVFLKEDIVQTFFAAGGVLLFHWATGRNRIWAWPVAMLIFLFALSEDVRAAMVGGVAALAGLLLAGRTRFALAQLSLATLAVTLLLFATLLPDQTWAETRLSDATARTLSIFRYDSQTARQMAKGYKIDNNRFRLVWWRTVAQQVVAQAPAFGLGFGFDLTASFIREYDQEMGEEFMARSPHSIVISSLGRMGAMGLAVWLWFCGAFACRYWQNLKSADPLAWGIWSALLIVLVSASFGVVLEGPMGAVPFWVLLGLACPEPQFTPGEVPPASTATLRGGAGRV